MTGSFIHVWEYLWSDLWGPLGDFSQNNYSAPQDLYIVLFDIADNFLSPGLTELELVEIRNDPVKAQQRFQTLKGTDFSNEIAIINFLEEVDQAIIDYDIPDFEEYYQQLLKTIIKKFNLRYRVDNPFVIRFLLPGSFDNLYAELHRINAGNVHLSGLIDDFEKAYDRYTRTQDPTDLKTCIHKASNYAEGLASLTCSQPGTLGELCNRLRVWPHDKMKEALQNLYRFCSDYPGIRHGGNQQNAHRLLAPRDAILTCLLVISFSGYLSAQIDEQIVLGV
jgi:hypothetical protein